ncbi:MAG: ferric reductase-like transmembrane domain-containing protein [Proteobacteria bacterium]|nr:hypothetical protein [Desulfobacula sp.]MBU3953682.1 ferric reductase-like transmembrane domain-containing protein [Pseudomonadota bacterium]MBU4132874.1 ferric reductase-like transmembrane domain-containing protein [Pseudomonadota bacterium]
MENDFKKKMFRAIIIAGALLLLVMAACIPFLFESPSLYYKLGMDKTWLRTGKVMGLLAAMLILFQGVLVSRFSFLGRHFSLKRLFDTHGICGRVILVLVLLHPFFIIAAENFTVFSLEKRYWPEFVGVGLLILIIWIAGGAIWRIRLGISQNTWRLQHRWGSLATVALLFVHVPFVSESFDSRIPLAGLGMAGLGAVLLFARIYYKRFFGR